MDLQLNGKKVLVSGSTVGIGLAIVTVLARGRSREKLQKARESIRSSFQPDKLSNQ